MSFLKRFLNLEYYESELDGFLKDLERKYPKPSASQRAEIEKYKRIYHLRDKTDSNINKKSDFMDNF